MDIHLILLGLDGLCGRCRHRRQALALANLWRAADITLVLGLPAVWLWLEALGLFHLTAEWVAVYVGGITASTALAFGIRVKPNTGGN